MNISKLLVLSLLATGLVCGGCKKNPGNVVVQETKSAPTTPVELKLKWPLNRHAIQTLGIKQTSVMTIPGLPQPMNQDMNMTMESDLTVTKEQPDGQKNLEMEYLSSKMSMSMNGKSMADFDSAKKATDKPNPMAATFGKLIGAKVGFVLDASNVVVGVEGSEDLQNRMTDSTGSDPNGMFKSMFSEDALKVAVDFSKNLPGKPVQVGDSWPVQREYPMGPLGTMIMDYTFTLNGWEKRHDRYCARIGMEGTLKSKPGETPKMQGMSFVIHDGTTSGETWFDLDMGMFVDTTLNQEMKMDITVPNPRGSKKPGAPKTMTIQSTMSQVITTKFELK